MIEEPTHFPKIFQCESLRIIVPVPVTDLKDKGRNDTLHVHQTQSVTATAMDQVLVSQFFSILGCFCCCCKCSCFMWSLVTA